MKKQNYPSIDIVVLNYNGYRYLQKTLPVLLSLNYPNYNIIVVDNNSEDESKSYIRQYPQLKLIENSENVGYSKGKNIGVEQAIATFVLLLDNDILLKDEDILLKLVKFYNHCQDKTAFISIPFIDLHKITTDSYGLYTNVRKKFVPLQKVLDKKSFEIPFPMGGLIFFKKEVWDDVGGLDEIFPYCIDDWDIGARSSILGYHNFLFSDTYAIHLGVNDIYHKSYFWKYKYELAGFMYMVTKNYTVKNLIKWYIVGYLYYIYKTLRKAVRRKSLWVVLSFIISHFIFLENFHVALIRRKQIQKRRKAKEDLFLKIKPPEFD